MTISAALFAWLKTAIAATPAANRVYPRHGTPPAAAFPYLNWFRVSGFRQHKVSRGAGDHARSRYQINIYAATQIEAESIAAAILAYMRTGAHNAPIVAIDVEGGPYDLPVEIEGQISQSAAVAVDLGVTHKET